MTPLYSDAPATSEVPDKGRMAGSALFLQFWGLVKLEKGDWR